MHLLDRQTARKFLTLLVLSLLTAGLYQARWVVLEFVIAVLVAYLLDPLVRFLQRHSLLFRNLRGPAVIEVYLVLLILIACVFHGAAPQLMKEPGRIVQNVSGFLDSLSSGDVANGISSKAGWSNDQALRLKAFLSEHRADLDKVIQEVEQVMPGLIEGLLLVPILAIFFLSDGRRIANGFIELAARWSNRNRLHRLASELDTTLREYIKTKVTLSGLSLLFYFIALLALRIPHALGLSVLGAVLEFIPVVGWVAAAATILSVAILNQSHWIWMAALLGLWRIAQDYINAPRVMGRHLEIHPLMSIFGLMVGWEISGIIGVYLSVPLMAVIGAIWRTSLSSEEVTQNVEAQEISSSVHQAVGISE